MEWFAAHNADRAITNAAAIVVVHESGSRMTIGRLIARGLHSQGLHAFLLHLPGYGARRSEAGSGLSRTLPSLQQAIADVRRARDAVVALPVVDSSVVGVQGTSLGGFITSTVAGLDDGYDRVFIFLAGGDLQEVVLHGAHDAAKIHKKINEAGVTDEQIKELARQWSRFVWPIESIPPSSGFTRANSMMSCRVDARSHSQKLPAFQQTTTSCSLLTTIQAHLFAAGRETDERTNGFVTVMRVSLIGRFAGMTER